MADGKSTTYANAILSRLRGVDLAALANVYLALFDSAGDELSGNGYARKQIACNDTNFPTESNRQISNGVAIAFDAATGAWSDIYRGKLMDAASSGNVIYQFFLGSDFGKFFTAIDAGDVVTVPGHSLVEDDRVVVLASDGATLPTGLTDETLYYVISVDGDDITLSLTEGGSAVNISAAGAGIIKKLTPKTGITSGDVVQFAVGELQIREA